MARKCFWDFTETAILMCLDHVNERGVLEMHVSNMIEDF